MWLIGERLSEGWDRFVRNVQSNKKLSAWARGQRETLSYIAPRTPMDLWSFGFDEKIKLADWFDKENRTQSEDIRKLKEQVFRKIAKRLRSGHESWNADDLLLLSDGAALAIAERLYNAVTMISAGYVDTLRLGQGVLIEQSAKGVFKDGLRLLQIIPFGSAANGFKTVVRTSRIRMLARIPRQSARTFECVTNAAARMMALVHGKLFVPIMDLWAAGRYRPPPGYPLMRGLPMEAIIPPLEEVGATVSQPAVVNSMNDVMQAARQNPNGAVLFGVKGTNNAGRPYAHVMMASAAEGGEALIYDTDGTVYRSWGQFFRDYPRPHSVKMSVVRGATLMGVLDVGINYGGLFQALALRARYIPFATLISVLTAWDYVDLVALSGPAKKSGPPLKHEQQHQSPKTKPDLGRVGGEPGWHDPNPVAPEIPLH